MLQCVAAMTAFIGAQTSYHLLTPDNLLQRVAAMIAFICVLQYVAVCCSMLQYVAVCCSVLQCVAVCCSVLQCVAVVIAPIGPLTTYHLVQCDSVC